MEVVWLRRGRHWLASLDGCGSLTDFFLAVCAEAASAAIEAATLYSVAVRLGKSSSVAIRTSTKSLSALFEA